ncbi:MAG TPA: 50S ribosomal protein L19e [Candidatus Bathyarchaeota archaeon]|nr:50S ribosomal protein L19e [Candidatus Bathyarchaeota archaeon]
MSLRSQRRMAAEILKAGEGRIWIDPERVEDVELAISREEIRKLIHEGAIRKLQKKGVSRARARILHEKRKKGRRRGPGSRQGAKGARLPRKKAWMIRIRAQRRRLRELRDKRIITRSVYRRLYIMAGSGAFRSVAAMERYISAHNLRRRR